MRRRKPPASRPPPRANASGRDAHGGGALSLTLCMSAPEATESLLYDGIRPSCESARRLAMCRQPLPGNDSPVWPRLGVQGSHQPHGTFRCAPESQLIIANRRRLPAGQRYLQVGGTAREESPVQPQEINDDFGGRRVRNRGKATSVSEDRKRRRRSRRRRRQRRAKKFVLDQFPIDG